MRVWVTAILWSLQASLSLAADLPEPVTPSSFSTPGATAVLLGRDLFYDPILSGNRNIACSSCHQPGLGTSDAVSLTLGEGGVGLGPSRHADPANPPPARLSRNTPALYNLGSREYRALTLDGRVEQDPKTRFGIRLPAPMFLERPVNLLAAQTLLPLGSARQMAGHPGENPVADAVAAGQITGLSGAWQILAERVEQNPDYRRRFTWLTGKDEPLHITDVASALAAFVAYEFRATDSPFDAFLRGDDNALSNQQLHGMSLFYGKANCASCHSGPLQTDHDFHTLGLPQIGPGQGHGPAYADHGRGAITGNASQRYAFRTPSLRNVALTAPYGHNGTSPDLAGIIRHHLDPETNLAEYLGQGAVLPSLLSSANHLAAMDDFDEVLNIGMAIDIAPLQLSETEVAALVAFMNALTDPVSLTGRLGPPGSVPSGLTPDLLADNPS